VVELTSLPHAYAKTAMVFGLLALSAPFAVSLVRNTRALSAMLVSSVASSREAGEEGSPLAAGALRVVLYLVVLLTIGLPAIVVLKPLGAGRYGLFVMLAL